MKRSLMGRGCAHHSRREDEDERGACGRVFNDSLHVEDGRFDELGTSVVDDELSDAKADAILTQRSHEKHPLQLVARIVPLACTAKT